ncbi:VOC family protein [Wenjunlia tyrosinilytica]|uniref:VOC domain-containing protein n=1 Tax=Wenjunlia tyrosinilytica TaxID=1544741 RepID=A0A917ZDY9_9ACTN|nr:VOC family protein [Wenjunlia tyrosinilytica]GGO81250.1 hypothetical protein GCM10012280_05030 [Wenjunlia tyrosinilytica]
MSDGAASRPTVYPTLRYRDARAAIDFLKNAFGFTEVAVHGEDEGPVHHAEMAYGNGLVMFGSAVERGDFSKAARDLGPASVYVVVEDTDKHHARAVAAGAEIVVPVTDQDYGSRDYTAKDPEGNLWTFGTYTPDFTAT